MYVLYLLLVCFCLVLLFFCFSYFLLYFPIFPYVPSECTVRALSGGTTLRQKADDRADSSPPCTSHPQAAARRVTSSSHAARPSDASSGHLVAAGQVPAAPGTYSALARYIRKNSKISQKIGKTRENKQNQAKHIRSK